MDGRRTLALLLAVSTMGCRAEGDRVESAFRVDTLASGLVQVTNDGTGLWTPDNRWTLEQDLRLGTVDEGGPEQFSQVAWIDEDSEGRIYILDYPAQEIRVFGPQGEYSHTIGRKGEGPGELTSAAGLNWGPDGNIWVWGSGRFSVFTPAGDFVTSWPRQTRGVIYPWNGGFTPAGDYIDWGLDRERGENPNETTGLTTMYPSRFTPPDSYDTLPPLRFQAWMRGPGQMSRGTNKGIMLAQTKSGHIWFAHTDSYVLYQRTLEGDTILTSSLPAEARQITDAEIDSIIRYYVEQGFPVRPEPDEFVRERRLVTRVLADNEGHIYVLPEEEDVAEGSVIDVFRDDGIYLGRMELDQAVLTRGPPPFVTGEHVYGVVTDEYDVPFVVRWRILKP